MQNDTNKNLIQRGLNWLTHHTLHKVTAIFTNKTSTQEPTQLLIFPYFAQNTQQARNYALQKIRNNIKDKNYNKTNHNVLNKLQKTSLFWGKRNNTQNKPHQLVCPICMDFLIAPVSTQCGHTFCWQCLDEAILFNPNCPVCRNNIRGNDLIQCMQLTAIVKNFLKLYQPECAKSPQLIYQARTDKFQEWKRKRNIDPKFVRSSDLLDVRDTEYVWCSCSVRQVLVLQGKMSLLIHYIGWSNIYDQVVQINSQRLANYKFYSARSDIPHYASQASQMARLQSYVVVDEQQIFQQHYDSNESLQQQQEVEIQIMTEGSSQQNVSEEGSILHQQIVGEWISKQFNRTEANPEVQKEK